ncbi:MAG: hypothetical protein AB1779_01010 [Candidatus Thermoplasmatota archaeon]
MEYEKKLLIYSLIATGIFIFAILPISTSDVKAAAAGATGTKQWTITIDVTSVDPVFGIIRVDITVPTCTTKVKASAKIVEHKIDPPIYSLHYYSEGSYPDPYTYMKHRRGDYTGKYTYTYTYIYIKHYIRIKLTYTTYAGGTPLGAGVYDFGMITYEQCEIPWYSNDRIV